MARSRIHPLAIPLLILGVLGVAWGIAPVTWAILSLISMTYHRIGVRA